MRPQPCAYARVLVFERERDRAQTKECLPDAEQKDDRDERERPCELQVESREKRREREPSEEERDEEKVRDKDYAPEVRCVDACNLQLTRCELNKLSERAVF